LDDGDDTGHELPPCYRLKIKKKRADGRPAQLAQFKKVLLMAKSGARRIPPA